MSGRGPQHPYGHRPFSNWGEGAAQAEYVVGDLVYVPEGCAAVRDARCKPGLHRVESCFSIGEDPSFYYRLCPAAVEGSKGQLRVKTNWWECSDRLHVIPGNCDYAAGWILLHREQEAAASCGEAPETTREKTS